MSRQGLRLGPKQEGGRQADLLMQLRADDSQGVGSCVPRGGAETPVSWLPIRIYSRTWDRVSWGGGHMTRVGNKRAPDV